MNHYLNIKNSAEPQYEPRQLFAIYYQVHRAFYHIFDFIVGSSMPMAKLRASIWQSVFTHDLRRYNRSLFNRMKDFTTLINGASGTVFLDEIGEINEEIQVKLLKRTF